MPTLAVTLVNVPARLALLTIALCGCSASGASYGPPAPSPEMARKSVSATFEIFIPKHGSTARDRVPPSKSASIGIENRPPVIANLTATTPGCYRSSDGVRCSVSSKAAAGTDTFAVSIFDGLNATGNKLSTAEVTQRIVAGQSNRVNVTLDGVMARIVLALQSAPPPEGKSASVGISVMAEDAKGNIIVGPGSYASPISLADSDSSKATKLSTTSVKAPSTHVTLAYNGRTLSSAGRNAHVTASAPGVSRRNVTNVYFVTAQDQWVTWGKSPYRNSYNPTETTLTQSNVGRLKLLWQTQVGGVVTGEPVIVGNVTGTSQGTVDVLYVGDAHGNLYAMNAGTGAVLWTKTVATETINGTSSDPAQKGCFDQPDGIYGIGGSPVADPALNTVYAVDGMGYLYGFDLATGAQALRTGPMWAYDANDNNFNITNSYSALTEDTLHHVIYVPGAAHCGNENYGGVQQYNLKSGAIRHWYSMGGPPNTYGGVWGPGGVVVSPSEASSPSSDSVYFVTGDGPTPVKAGQYPYSIVRLKENMSVSSASVDPVRAGFPGDVDFGDTPLVFAPSASSGCSIPMLLAAEGKNGVLYLLSASNLSAGPIQTVQLGTYSTDGVNLGTASYDPTRNLVYINNGSDSSSLPIKHGLVAFTVTSACQLKLAWQAAVGPNGQNDGPPSPPTVANGVVYYADGPGSSCTPVDNGGCGASPADFNAYDASSGALLFHAAVPGPLFTPPVVVNGHVYLTSWYGGGPGEVFCFGLPNP